jgi:hypothetical protein
MNDTEADDKEEPTNQVEALFGLRGGMVEPDAQVSVEPREGADAVSIVVRPNPEEIGALDVTLCGVEAWEFLDELEAALEGKRE